MRGHGFETVQQTNLLLVLEKKAACNAGPGSRLIKVRIGVAGGAVYAACNAGLGSRLLKGKIGGCWRRGLLQNGKTFDPVARCLQDAVCANSRQHARVA